MKQSGQIHPSQFADALARKRPPAVRRVDVSLAAHEPHPSFRLPETLATLLREVVTSWPAKKTIFSLTLGRGYLQGWRQGSTLLLEFGGEWPHTATVLRQAQRLGWIDPNAIPAGHGDFRSRAVWERNPIIEIEWADSGVPALVATLAATAHELLGYRAGGAIGIQIFTDATNDDEVRSLVAAAANGLALVALTELDSPLALAGRN